MSSLYKQLGFSNPNKQIRLLRLEPSPIGTDDHAFSMEVHDFQGNTRPSFTAISYTWGAAVPLLPVVINGFRMRVRFNCWYALWQMRHHEGVGDASFWIDSLCINQDNDNEKGHQVAMMGEIFASASSVAASLGTGESLGNVREILASGDKSEIGKLRGRFDQLPYFDRVWIKQEIVLAKDISIFYGLERLSWSQFQQAVNDTERNTERNAWSSQHDNSDSISSPFRHQRLDKHSASMQLCNHRSQVTKTSTLMDLVVKYETAKASVAADKIYALLSLLSQTDPIRRNLPIIYGEATRFPLFRTLVRLVYSHYRDQNLGDKHSVLCIIRDWLGICGLDEDVSAFLESQACHPWDTRSFNQESATVKIMHQRVLNDENSGELKPEDLRVEVKQTGPSDAVRKLSLSGHDGITSYPRRRFRSPTGRDSCSILPELHIPPQLKSLKTLYSLANGRMHRRPTPGQRYLVNSDVRPGDFLGTLVWDANRDDKKLQWDYAHVILRRTTFADESESQDYGVSLEDETKRRRTAFFLHSWAIPVFPKCTMLSELSRFSRTTSNAVVDLDTDRGETRYVGRFRLHYRDALIPLLLNYHPLQSLLYSKDAFSPGAINLLSRLEDPEDFGGEGGGGS